MNRKIDWNHARDAVGGNIDLLLELIDIFFAEYPKLIAGIGSSIESQSVDELRLFAHTLKGSLRYFGELHAGQLAYELEVMGHGGQFERAKEVFGQLQTEMDTVLPELKAFVASQAPESDA